METCCTVLQCVCSGVTSTPLPASDRKEVLLLFSNIFLPLHPFNITNFQCIDFLRVILNPSQPGLPSSFCDFLSILLPSQLPSFRVKVRVRVRIWLCTLWITQRPHPCGAKLENSAPSDIKPQKSPEGKTKKA